MKFSKFLILIICVFCIAFCVAPVGREASFASAFAKTPQKEQNFNTVLQETLVSTPNVEIPKQFQAVVYKTLYRSETLKKTNSNLQEFEGVKALRAMLGEERKKFDTTFIYLGNDKPIVAKGSSTWYIMNNNLDKPRFRLYYQKTPVAEATDVDDLLFVAKTKNDKLFVIVVNSKSAIKDKLLASLNNETSAPDTTKEKNAYKEISNIVTMPPIQPTENWVQVFFTPGTDCEDNIIARLNTVKKADIVVYSITNENIVNAIKRAHERGAKIRVITDLGQSKGKKSRVQELIDAGIPVRMNADPWKIEHNKYAVFDGKEVQNGSYNWTTNATNNNSENCAFFKQKQAVDKFSDRYEYLWKFYDQSKDVAKVSFFCSGNMAIISP